jgi:hypothetical protein
MCALADAEKMTRRAHELEKFLMQTKGKKGQAAKRPIRAQRTERQPLRCSIDVFSDCIVVSRYQGQTVSRRVAEPADLAAIMGRLAGRQASSGGWRLLGRNVLAEGHDANGRLHQVVALAAHTREIRCQVGKRVKSYRVHLPALVAEMIAEVNGGSLRWTGLGKVLAFAGKPADIREGTRLYAPPLPNCHGDGGVCMGDVPVAAGEKATAAGAFKRAFMDSTFTDHLLAQPIREGSKLRDILHGYRVRKGRIRLADLKSAGTFGKVFAAGGVVEGGR